MVDQGDKLRRPRSPDYKIGAERRFRKLANSMDHPGAIYNPSMPLHLRSAPKISFGKASDIGKQGRKIENLHSTPANIGPNKYFTKGYPEALALKRDPSIKIPSALRSVEFNSRGAVNETYED